MINTKITRKINKVITINFWGQSGTYSEYVEQTINSFRHAVVWNLRPGPWELNLQHMDS